MKALIDEETFVRFGRCTWPYGGAATPALRGQARAVENYVSGRGEDVAESLCRRDLYGQGGCSRSWAPVHAFNDRRDTDDFVEALETQGG